MNSIKKHSFLAPKGTVAEVFQTSLPFIISSGVYSLKLSCDRMLLAWHSKTDMFAAISGGLTAFMVASLFIGIAGYTSVFVSQYYGSGQHRKIGLLIWQSLLFSLAAGLLVAILGQSLSPIFAFIGHNPELAAQESIYFRLLTGGAVLSLLSTSLMCFWTGRRKTWTIVAINLLALLFSLILDWLLIFGHQGSEPPSAFPLLTSPILVLNHLANYLNWPALGLTGAGLATIITDGSKTLLLLILFLAPGHRREFNTVPSHLYDSGIFIRLLRFGLGNGVQFLLNVGAFAIFNIIIGLYSTSAGDQGVVTASGMAFSISTLAFIPITGLSSTAAMMVSHGLGAGDTGYVERAMASARILGWIYMSLVTLFFLVCPGPVISLFAGSEGLGGTTMEQATLFLALAAAFFTADGWSMLYGSAIRGAGDTDYSMKVTAVSTLMLALPCLLAFLAGAGAIFMWTMVIGYSSIRAMAYYLRFRQGHWLKLRLVSNASISE